MDFYFPSAVGGQKKGFFKTGKRKKRALGIFYFPIFSERFFKGRRLGEPTGDSGPPWDPRRAPQKKKPDREVVRKRNPSTPFVCGGIVGVVMRDTNRGREKRMGSKGRGSEKFVESGGSRVG